MTPPWQERSADIHMRFLRLAQAKGRLTSDAEVLNFLALAVCDEAGEFANLVKKLWRDDELDRNLLQDELADIRIYLEHLTRHLGIDLDKACERKVDEVAQRVAVKEAAPDYVS